MTPDTWGLFYNFHDEGHKLQMTPRQDWYPIMWTNHYGKALKGGYVWCAASAVGKVVHTEKQQNSNGILFLVAILSVPCGPDTYCALAISIAMIAIMQSILTTVACFHRDCPLKSLWKHMLIVSCCGNCPSQVTLKSEQNKRCISIWAQYQFAQSSPRL